MSLYQLVSPYGTFKSLPPHPIIPANFSLCAHISLIYGMSDPSGSSHFRVLFEAALEDYRKRTGTKLVDHPLYGRLIKCDTVESITAVLQEQAQAFLKFRGKDDSKVMKSLKCAVHVLHSLSDSTFLGEAIGLVRLIAALNVPGP